MDPEIRKIVTYDEETLIEGYRAAETPWRMFAVAALCVTLGRSVCRGFET